MLYTFLDLVQDVLKQADKPMTYQEIWQKANELDLSQKIKTSGKTPWLTLGSRLFVDVRDNLNSSFIKVGKRPARFFLKSRESEVSDNIIKKIEIKESRQIKEKRIYDERDLHPLLTYFVYANPSFGRGKGILTKSIYHESSKKKGYSEWLYPDLVGFYIPLNEWESDSINLGKLFANDIINLYSFELKISLNKGNYREAYFQSVSNSSWAHEGYLVASEIKQDDELFSELERLTASFGIGIILLDLSDFDSSSILFPARPKTNLDWETINKLCAQNEDFKKFIQDVKIDFESCKIHNSEYDEIIDDPDEYIKTHNIWGQAKI